MDRESEESEYLLRDSSNEYGWLLPSGKFLEPLC